MAARRDIAEAVSRALARYGVEVPSDAVHLERPARREHGDWSTNAALVNSKKLARPPRDLASDLAEAIRDDPPAHLVDVEVAGPGFVNLRLAPGWLHDTLVEVVTEGEENYARPDLGHGERVQVEFISANPDRSPARGQRLVGLLWRRARQGHGTSGLERRPRVLRERHRRPGANPRSESSCAPPRRARRRRRLPGLVRR